MGMYPHYRVRVLFNWSKASGGKKCNQFESLPQYSEGYCRRAVSKQKFSDAQKGTRRVSD